MNQRLALLSAILATPDDDLPRLVFADWLEENGTTDADAARVEFIRLGCKSKAKLRITPKEGDWLDENWERLLGNTIATAFPNQEQYEWSRKGRHLRVIAVWNEHHWTERAGLTFSFMRGFALRIEYCTRRDYLAFWRNATIDEPLAYHRPDSVISPNFTPGPTPGREPSVLSISDWGEDVFNRTTGFDTQPASHFKHFTEQRAWTVQEIQGISSYAIRDEIWGFEPPPQHRLRVAVATAMTAIAREFVGLDPL